MPSARVGTGELAWVLPLAAAWHAGFCFHMLNPFSFPGSVPEPLETLPSPVALLAHFISYYLCFFSSATLESPLIRPQKFPSLDMEEEKRSLLPSWVLTPMSPSQWGSCTCFPTQHCHSFPCAPPLCLRASSFYPVCCFLCKNHLSTSNIFLFTEHMFVLFFLCPHWNLNSFRGGVFVFLYCCIAIT